MYYRWPCGMFEEIGGMSQPWAVYSMRPMPCTPAGDIVATFASKELADAAAAELNAGRYSLEEALTKYNSPNA